MLIFDISYDAKLPPESHWLSPNFSGDGDKIYQSLISEQSKSIINDPKNWADDFKKYVYQFPHLQKLKNKLNTTKKILDPIYDDRQEFEKYSVITDLIRIHDDLRSKNGRLVKEYGAEIATNAWMKMYEICTLLDPIFAKYSKADSFNTFHIAECPGTFMLAINHYIQNHYPTTNWKWLANSYRDLYSKSSMRDTSIQNTHYLVDQYGLINKYYNNWLFGADGDGDITSPSNIISFGAEIEKRLGSLHFISSDVKYVPLKINFDEEERYNIPVHMGHLLSALFCLNKGGTMMVKESTFFEAQSLSLLFLAAASFKKLLLVKPEVSRPANSEAYIVGFGYRKNISAIQMDHLLKIMGYIRFLNTDQGSPAIFLKDDIPYDFVDLVSTAVSGFCDKQIPQIRRNIELFNKYKEQTYSQIKKDMMSIRKKTADQWIKKVKISPLNPNNWIGNIKKTETSD